MASLKILSLRWKGKAKSIFLTRSKMLSHRLTGETEEYLDTHKYAVCLLSSFEMVTFRIRIGVFLTAIMRRSMKQDGF